MFGFDPIFCDRAILQAEKPLRISGFGAGEISITLGQTIRTAEAKDGKWTVEFEPQEY